MCAQCGGRDEDLTLLHVEKPGGHRYQRMLCPTCLERAITAAFSTEAAEEMLRFFDLFKFKPDIKD